MGLLVPGERLACRVRVEEDLSVHVPGSSLFSAQRLQAEGRTRTVAVDPFVRSVPVAAEPPSREDGRADLERVVQALGAEPGIPAPRAEPAVLRQLSPLARERNWQLTAHLRDGEIVGFSLGGRGAVGLAVDLGSTKVAGYLVDLATGAELAAGGTPNPQIAYGEDVVSRLGHASRSREGARELASVLRDTVDALAGELAQRAGVARDQIADACLVGNTAIVHLLLELPAGPLSVSPFVSATSFPMDCKAREIGLTLAPGAYVHVLPAVGGFVGADHTAMILASELDCFEGTALGVDIGTNTEVVVTCPARQQFLSASCASGPAFEGAHMRDGMRAAPGAIESVRLTPDGPRVETIGDALPVGICGSGIVDAVAELRRTGILEDRGRFRRDTPGVRRGTRGDEFVLVPGERSGTGRDVVITQKDVSEIQLAKGAIAAGIATLMEAARVAPGEVDEVVVAGAFGSYLNLESARAIGLLPRLPRARYLQVGNAAGEGAKLALLSRAERRRAGEIGRRLRHVELNNQPGFRSALTRALRFPEIPPDPFTPEGEGSTTPC
jgi:uncharacterized 2Fe-2S/4Fe-4S cluster protein (DUF4445 family)